MLKVLMGMVFLMIIALAYYGFRKKESKTTENQEQSAADNGVRRQQAESIIDRALEKLLELQLLVREKNAGTEILALIEPIIDRLGEIIPRLNEEYPGSELTFTANQMAERYLPDLVGAFLALPGENREQQQKKLIETLQSISGRLETTVQAVVDRDESRFEVESKFLSQKFK